MNVKGNGEADSSIQLIRQVIPILAVVVLIAGCFGPAPISQPKYTPGAVADAAITEFDTNKDGKLDEKELQGCPPLLGALRDLDKDSDGGISRAELESRILEFSKSNTGLLSVACKVTRGGQPLPNAEVTFIPEKFHGDSIKPAAGKSDVQGMVELRTDGSSFPGLSLGFYRVQVSLKDEGGKETIPAAYNTQTTLGQQVRGQTRGGIEVNIP